MPDIITELNAEDYQNLLTMAQGRNPLWNFQSLHKCANVGLVNRKGTFLTREGRRKAQRLLDSVNRLQTGLPLNSRPINRASELSTVSWKRGLWGNKHIWFNGHVLFNGWVPETFFSVRVDASGPEYAWVDREIKLAIQTKPTQLAKLTPIAVQIDQVGGLEVVCFKLPNTRSFRLRWLRMQTKYFDFINETWKAVTFWCHPHRPQSPIMVKNSFGNGFNNKIQALVLPVTGNWPVPKIDDSRIDTEGYEDVQEKEEKEW